MNSDTQTQDDASSETETQLTALNSMEHVRASVSAIETAPDTASNSELTSRTTSSTDPDSFDFGSVMSIDQAVSMQIQADILTQLQDIYRFFIRIGVVEEADVSFSAREFTHAQLEALKNSNCSPGTITFLKQLPRSTEPINLDWNSPIINWFNNSDEEDMSNFVDLRNGHGRSSPATSNLKFSEIPLTEWHPDSLGFHWVVDVEEGTLSRRYLRSSTKNEEGALPNEHTDAGQISADEQPQQSASVDGLDWHGDAIHLLGEYLTDLENLEMIPIKLWTEHDIKPGFVTQSESVYEDVKAKLLEYGWLDKFKREQWIRDLPGLVEVWKGEKVTRLEQADEVVQAQ